MDIEQINLSNPIHQEAFLVMMNYYMEDEMGLGNRLPNDLGERIVEGVKKQSNYLGIIAFKGDEVVGMANCFINFSTFKAKPFINIHDFIVSPHSRRMGVGESMLQWLKEYGRSNGFCRLNLEVRYDNPKAMNLYKKESFVECEPPMYFWQCDLLG